MVEAVSSVAPGLGSYEWTRERGVTFGGASRGVAGRAVVSRDDSAGAHCCAARRQRAIRAPAEGCGGAGAYLVSFR